MSEHWTSPAQCRQQVLRLWERGDLLRSVIAEQMGGGEDVSEYTGTVFPLKLRLKKPDSRAMGARFGEVRQWMQSIAELRYIRVEYKETRHPQLGLNSIPGALWIDKLGDALTFIGTRKECIRFQQQLDDAVTHDQRLLQWIFKRPLKVLELSDAWSRLLRLHKALIEPRAKPLYLRRISVDGIDTKFIEAHRTTLSEWLDITLPANRIDEQHRGGRGFARRYGFKDKPARLRLRSLDPAAPLFYDATTAAERNAFATADMAMDVDVIQRISPQHTHVLMTENEINYLALPYLSDTLGIFGSGYGWQSLHDIPWLSKCMVWYWGDIDTHGFAILDELRAVLPHVQSIMMNNATLIAHQNLWGHEHTPTGRTLSRLTEAEQQLYNDLSSQRYAQNVRLEQEQIGYEFMLEQLQQIAGEKPDFSQG